MEVPSGNGWLKRPLSHDPIGGEVIPAPAVSLAVRSQGLELRHRRRQDYEELLQDSQADDVPSLSIPSHRHS